MSNLLVIPNSASAVDAGLDSAGNAIDGNDSTFASNKTNGFVNTEDFRLTTHLEQAVVVAIKIHWSASGDFSYVRFWTGPASSPQRDLLLDQRSSVSDRTDTLYLSPSKRVPVADLPNLRVQVFGTLSTTTLRIKSITFILADRCSLAACEGAA